MPFWWRRRKQWRSNYRFSYRKRRNRFRKPRRRFHRRRHRRATRRRRRRYKPKVRRKKKFIKLLQWQPQSIRKCKIKGIDTIILGANGKQFRNYTFAINEWTPPTTPTGGGISTAKYSLAYLYEQFILGNNIWTTSNCDYDLVRYTGASFTFYRHPRIDFIVVYQLQYPLTLSPQTLQDTHPRNLLLQKHKIVIPSLKLQPWGKRYIKKKVKPPKQMTNKWFFMHSFTETGLVLLKAAACDLGFSHLGEQGENELTSFYSLNIDTFFTHGAWGQAQPYFPISTWSPTVAVQYTPQKGPEQTYNITSQPDITRDYEKGWFSSILLTAKKFTKPSPDLKPLLGCRYNPKIDTGKNNYVYLLAVQADKFDPPSHDKILITWGKPLWLLLLGWTDYIRKLRENINFMKTYFLVIQSPALAVGTRKSTPDKPVIPIDDSFLQGKGPYNTDADNYMKEHWYPCLMHQQQTINNIVKTGPFIPKAEGKISNWELHAKYSFYFKWGGSTNTNDKVCDPANATTYPGPDPISQTVQIVNPKSQIPESLLHIWDWRRNFLTKKAIKRMSENLPPESTISTDSDLSEPHQKKRKTTKVPSLQEKETKEKICLQQLFEGNSYQEIPQEEIQDPIQQLIYQQQQQQQHIKHNLLNLITCMKETQLQMQIQTGIL
nr:MAG: ORF1 [Torque teno midi virus]